MLDNDNNCINRNNKGSTIFLKKSRLEEDQTYL